MGGDWRSKIVPVKGDIAEENLGMSDEDWEMLQEDVEIVFHSAATVRFDEDLKWVSNERQVMKWQYTTFRKNYLGDKLWKYKINII